MARDKDDFVPQRQQGLGDRLDQRTVIPTGKVGAADAAGKQHIANPGEFFGLVQQHDMARGVAGAEVDIQLALAKLHLVTLLQPAIRRERGGMGEAEHLALLGQHVEPEGVLLVGAGNGDASFFPQLGSGTDVIQMTVGQQDMSQGQAALGDGSQQFVRFAARIDQGGLMGLVTPDEGAVLGELGDRDHLEFQHRVPLLGWVSRAARWHAARRNSRGRPVCHRGIRCAPACCQAGRDTWGRSSGSAAT